MQPQACGGFWQRQIDSVTPDVVVVNTPDGWVVELNGAAFPKLLAYPPSKNDSAKSRGADEAKKFMTERFGRAKWLVNALEQRAKTTLAVARAVVAAQRQFLVPVWNLWCP